MEAPNADNGQIQAAWDAVDAFGDVLETSWGALYSKTYSKNSAPASLAICWSVWGTISTAWRRLVGGVEAS